MSWKKFNEEICRVDFLLISHVARLSFTSQWLKIFSESLVIKVSNSNSKEEQIRIVHHWWATSHGPPMVWSGFSAWNFVLEILVICAASWTFCSHLSPCQALAKALEQNSTLMDLDFGGNLAIRLETGEARRFRREVLLCWELGSAVSQSPASRVLHKPPSKGHSGPPKHVI